MRSAALLAAMLLPACIQAAPARFAVRAKTFDGATWHESALVVVAGDRIESMSLGGPIAPDGVAVLEIPGASLTPGFIDCDSALGLADGRDELPEAASPDLLVADAFAPDEGESEAFRSSGVTLAWLATGPPGVVGGQGALVQPSRGAPTILSRSHGYCASLMAEASQYDRAPTSRAEQVRLLADLPALPGDAPNRVRFDDAGSAAAPARGSLRSFVLVGLPPTPGAAGAGPAILSGLDASVPLDVLRRSTEMRLDWALGSGAAESPRALRLAAAALVQAGVPGDEVLRALTSDAGRLAGAGGRGVIAAGRPADLVLWSGDPVSCASRPLRTWVAGMEVHRED